MINIEKEKCTACGACTNICPNNSITMKYDEEGFLYPLIDKEKCMNCSLCEEICPILNKPEQKNRLQPKVYAAWSLDDQIRINSTSGGIFTEFARVILSDGGYVVGAKYNESHMVEHYIINDKFELSILRQSKYVQSKIGFVFRDIKELLDEDKFVLFIGAPCQTVGLLKFLGKKYNNLLLLDFICRGVNSPKAYLKYLESLKRQYNSDIKNIWFKNKMNGWNQFGTKIEFENGKEYYADRYTDLFMKGYLNYNLYIRPCCSQCQFKGFPRYSDVTLGDFWGVKLDNKSLDTDKGTSVVMIHSQKGEAYFNILKNKIFCEERNLEDVLPFNQCAIKSIVMGKNREYFFENIDKVDFDELMKTIEVKV